MLAITGGEPMIHPHFKKIVSLFQPHVKNLVIETNLSLLDSTLVDFLKNKKNIIIQTSIEGTRNESKRGIDINFIKKKFKLLKENNIRTAVLFTPIKFNRKDFDLILVTLKENTDFFSIERMIPVGRGKNLEKLDKNSFFKIVEYCKNHNVSCNDPLGVLVEKRENKFIGCSAGIFACCIDSNLNLYPCPNFEFLAVR
ncbi:MAG: hypothetical protein QXE93_01425 [Candidatus Pacearchaeota archaeon]